MTEVSRTKINPVWAKVVSVSKDRKTAKVEIPRVVRHPKYGKTLHRKIVLLVDTAEYGVDAGTKVEILPCRRISKRKTWKVVNVPSAN